MVLTLVLCEGGQEFNCELPAGNEEYIGSCLLPECDSLWSALAFSVPGKGQGHGPFCSFATERSQRDSLASVYDIISVAGGTYCQHCLGANGFTSSELRQRCKWYYHLGLAADVGNVILRCHCCDMALCHGSLTWILSEKNANSGVPEKKNLRELGRAAWAPSWGWSLPGPQAVLF